jgi:hypothetical protein
VLRHRLDHSPQPIQREVLKPGDAGRAHRTLVAGTQELIDCSEVVVAGELDD